MFDANNLFTDATAVTGTGSSTVLDLKKTSAVGVDVEICVTAVAGSTTGLTLDAVVQESASSGSGFTTVATFDQITTTGRWARRFQSKKRYAKILYTAGAATGLSFTVTAGIVSGIQRDHAA